MPELPSGHAFAALFDDFSRSARRLETRDHYAGDHELFQQWRAGELAEPALAEKVAAWLERVRATTTAGASWQRVRVVREPPTNYQRFALATCRGNIAAGEDIRYLKWERANELGLPDHDFWLFDDERVALLFFTADDWLLGAHVLSDAALVEQHRLWFDVAFAGAERYADYLATDPTRERMPG